MTLKNPSQVELYGEILDIEVQYRKDVGEHTPLTDEEEERRIEQARLGEISACQAIIEDCLVYVMHVARKYADISRINRRWCVEYLDLVQIGNLALVEAFQKALGHPNPYGYLKRSAAGQIIKYCLQHGSSITSPQEHGKTYVPTKFVESYDAPIMHADGETSTIADTLVASSEQEKQEKDYSTLHMAVESLAPRQKSVITRHYGLECAPEDLYTISCSILLEQGKPLKENANAAYSAHKYALVKLRKNLDSACA